ncbi:MAG: chemotaxis protein CheB [Cyanobacteria bacterium P01_A01_bin.114]
MENRSIVVIGASAGGIETLKRLFSQLPGDLPASFFVVLHLSPDSPGLLANLLNNAGPLTAKTAEQGEPILPGHVYVAPPNAHLLLRPGSVQLYRGPRESRHCPAIDLLFRSAAVAYQSQVIGAILTGFLRDGVSGLLAIKRCGGTVVVQDPQDADYPELPKNAIATLATDYQRPIGQMGQLIEQLVKGAGVPEGTLPNDVISADVLTAFQRAGPVSDLATDSRQVQADSCCPVLTKPPVIQPEQALGVAIQTLEDHANTAARLAQLERDLGRPCSAQVYQEEFSLLKAHAQVLRNLLTGANGKRASTNGRSVRLNP